MRNNLKTKAFGYVCYIADSGNFIIDYAFAKYLSDEVTLLFAEEDGVKVITTTVDDVPRMARAAGLNATYKMFECEIPMYWSDENDSK